MENNYLFQVSIKITKIMEISKEKKEKWLERER